MATQTVLPGHFVFSQSALQDNSQCRRRFLLRYMRRLEWPAPRTAEIEAFEAAARRGQLFHRLIEQEQLGLAVEHQVHSSGDPLLQKWWKNYRDWQLEDTEHLEILSEVEISVPFAGYRLMARFDRVLVGKDKLVLIDWKTGRQAPDLDRYRSSWQSAVYRYVAAEGGHVLPGAARLEPEDITLVYWFAGFPELKLELAYSKAEHLEQKRKIAAAIEGIAAARTPEDFPLANTNEPCRRCSYYSFCRQDIQPSEGWDSEEETWDWDLLPEAEL